MGYTTLFSQPKSTIQWGRWVAIAVLVSLGFAMYRGCANGQAGLVAVAAATTEFHQRFTKREDAQIGREADPVSYSASTGF